MIASERFKAALRSLTIVALLLAAAASAAENEYWLDGGFTFPFVIADAEGHHGAFWTNPVRPSLDDHSRKDLAYAMGGSLVAGGRWSAGFEDPYAEVVLSARLGSLERLEFLDEGSYLRLGWPSSLGEWVLTAYPFAPNTIRAGYSNRLSLGAGEIFGNSHRRAVSGALAGLSARWGYAYVAGQGTSVSVADEELDIFWGSTLATGWGAFAAAGVDLVAGLRLEAMGAHFDLGTHLRQAVYGEPLIGRAAALRISYASGLPHLDPVTYRPLVNDPFSRDSLFENRAGDMQGFFVSASALVADLSLADPDVHGTLEKMVGGGADLNAELHLADWRFDLLYRVRSPGLLLYGARGFNPGYAFQDEAKLEFEHGAMIGVACRVLPWLAPRVSFGLVRQAALTSESFPFPLTTTSRTVVVTDVEEFWILPVDEESLFGMEGRLAADFYFGSHAAVALEATYLHEPNRTEIARNDGGGFEFAFVNPTTRGLNLLLRVVF